MGIKNTNQKAAPHFRVMEMRGGSYKPNYNWRKVSAISAAHYSDTLVKKAQPVPLQANE